MPELLDFILGPRNNLDRKLKAQELDDKRRGLLLREELGELLSGASAVPTDRILDPLGGPATPIPSATPGGLLSLNRTRAGQRRLMGLFGELAPGVVAQSMLPAARANTSMDKLQAFEQAVGRKATEVEAQNIFGAVPDQSASIDAMRATVDFLVAKQNLIDAETEAEQDAAERARSGAEFGVSLITSGDTLLEMAELSRRLGDRSATGGGTLAEERGAAAGLVGQALAGMGAEEFGGSLMEGASDIQRFVDLTNNLAVDRLGTLGNFDANTNTRFQTFLGTKPDPSRFQRARDLQIADNIKAVLFADEAAAANPDLVRLSAEKRAALEAEERKLREQTLPPERIAQMTGSDILSLDPEEIDKFTEEQKAALSRRMDELGL